MFYVSRVLRTDTSIVDSSNFFLSPAGKTDLKAELHATIVAMHRPVDPMKPNDHPLCLFPRRTSWIIDKLNLNPESYPRKHCGEYQKWRSLQKATGVSLVFASYYVNNPASMFGHTFIRLHRAKTSKGTEPNALLDSAVNFAANPNSENPLLYPFLGLTGQFPGYFSLLPYYLKVQEYNNSESRDLWEYPLNLTAAQLDHLMETMWELGPVQINYWYIDENCSYVLLMLLDTIDSKFRLAEGFNVMATPADTLRVAAAAEGLLGEPTYRPSALAKYLEREQVLSRTEISLLKKIIQLGEVELEKTLAGLSSESRARTIDAALDFIDFDEGVAANKMPEKRKQRRVDLLRIRSGLQVAPTKLVNRPEQERSDKGHLSMRIGFTVGGDKITIKSKAIGSTKQNADTRIYTDYDWRPTLHDLNSPSKGYSSDLQIKLLEFKFRKYGDVKSSDGRDRQESAFIKTVNLFEVLSTPPIGPVLKPISWTANIGSSQPISASDGMTYRIRGGAGYTVAAGRFKSFAFGLAHISTEGRRAANRGIGPAMMVGANYEAGFPLKLSLRGTRDRTFVESFSSKKSIRDELMLDSRVVSIINDAHEISAYMTLNRRDTDIFTQDYGISYGIYF